MQGSNREIVDELRDWLAADEEPDPLIIETSGSTGTPKRVVLSRAAILASVAATTRRLGAEGCWLLTLPATYVAGLQVVVRSLVAGFDPVLVADHPSFAKAYAAAPDAPRFVSLVSAQLPALLDDHADLTALRNCHTVLLGGGRIDAELRLRAEAEGVDVLATYGSSETAGGCVYDGLPLDGVAVAVAEDGRIRIAGPMLFSGYDGDTALTADSLIDGWFFTSDRGEFDEFGRLRVLGRIDEVVVSGGVNVPTSEVAARLRQHPGVMDVAVVGVPDERWGQRIVAVFSTSSANKFRSTKAVTLEEVRDHVAQTLPRAWAPRQLVVVGELPMLPNGKTDRLEVIRMAEGEA